MICYREITETNRRCILPANHMGLHIAEADTPGCHFMYNDSSQTLMFVRFNAMTATSIKTMMRFANTKSTPSGLGAEIEYLDNEIAKEIDKAIKEYISF